MRVIAGYPGIPALTKRSAALRVICTLPDTTEIDVSSAIQMVEVKDTLEAEPSTASLRISRAMADGWKDPTSADSPWEPGNRISIEMGELGGALTRIFEGVIMSGGDSAGVPEARNAIRAIGGNPQWWQRAVTTEEYTAADTDDIVVDVFETWGGLTAPGDFDLPGVARVLAAMQALELSIMPLAFDLYAALGVVPWWDPVQLKLSTLDASIPVAPDITLPDAQRDRIDLSWAIPSSTRVRLQGGVKAPVVRVECGQWTTPANKYVPGPTHRHVGVQWASGGMNDAHEAPYWAQNDGTFPHGGPIAPGDWLWIKFLGAFGPDGQGYQGPENVEWIMNDPLVSLDPVNVIVPVPAGWGHVTVGHVEDDRYGATTYRQLATALLSIDFVGGGGIPGAMNPDQVWASMLAGGSVLDFEFWGRQKEPESAQQLSAQAWDDSGITAHGDQGEQIRNATLLTATDPYSDVEAEAVRLQAVEEALRLPAVIECKGQDLRLLPGDCVATPHPRDSYSVYVWLRTVIQKWVSGKATTSLVGSIVGTDEP